MQGREKNKLSSKELNLEEAVFGAATWLRIPTEVEILGGLARNVFEQILSESVKVRGLRYRHNFECDVGSRADSDTRTIVCAGYVHREVPATLGRRTSNVGVFYLRILHLWQDENEPMSQLQRLLTAVVLSTCPFEVNLVPEVWRKITDTSGGAPCSFRTGSRMRNVHNDQRTKCIPFSTHQSNVQCDYVT